MSRHRILTIVASATLVLTLLAAPAPLSLAQPTAATDTDEPLPGSATGKVRVVFADAAAAGKEVSRENPHGHVVRVFEKDPAESVRASIRRWKKVPGVIDARLEIFATPTIDDSYWAYQWDIGASTIGSSRAENAWATTTGAETVVVAVLDTGRTEHPELIAAMTGVAGADMLTDPAIAGDGNGRDTNPSDEGDWCAATGSPSNWHGTHVAGTIAAQHNSTGIRGIAPNVKLMHVRVLGHCGGDFVDVVDGIRWAAGLSTDYLGQSWDPPLSTNPDPADVINLSLGGVGKCSTGDFTILRTAISAARASGSVVVVAAGNESVNVQTTWPAGCTDAFTVAATGPLGGRASYSNFGNGVDLAAPGGDIVSSSSQGIISTVEVMSVDGEIRVANRAPTGLFGYAFYDGTSMAAPHVTGAAALLRSVWPNASAEEVESELRATARLFPARCSGCGAGLLDIAALVSRTPQDTLTIDNDPIVTLGVGISSTLATEGGSGDGAVTLATSTPSFCSVRGLVVTGKKVGICTVTATKGRSTTNFPTTSAAVSFTVIAPPKVTRAPSVTLAIDKITVSVTDGTWTNGGTTSYAWYRCTSASRTVSCTPIDGETTSSYTVNRPTDIGYFIRAQVTMTNNGISVSAWSNATAKIVAL